MIGVIDFIFLEFLGSFLEDHFYTKNIILSSF
jgi:hypothetical protein